ncbi:hypothetical protein GCM10020216_106140 [Nonomuraea helvata]
MHCREANASVTISDTRRLASPGWIEFGGGAVTALSDLDENFERPRYRRQRRPGGKMSAQVRGTIARSLDDEEQA